MLHADLPALFGRAVAAVRTFGARHRPLWGSHPFHSDSSQNGSIWFPTGSVVHL